MVEMNTMHLRNRLLGLLIVLAPLSFTPSVAWPVLGFDSFRIGLYQVLILAYVAVSSAGAVRYYIKNKLTKNDRFIFGSVVILFGLMAYNLLRAENIARSSLMSASVALLLWAMACVYVHMKQSMPTNPIATYLLKAGILYGVVSVGQLVVASIADNALVCERCSAGVFGFPRINGFGAEPLFWANSLLPFFAVSLWHTVAMRSRLAYVSLFSTTLAIGLTFARGAYVAVYVMVFAFVLLGDKQQAKKLVHPFGAMITGFMLSWVLLISSASYIYRATDGIAKETLYGMIEHVTLGKVVLDSEEIPAPVPATVSTEATFESQGFVESSSNDRLSAAELAIKAFSNGSQFSGVGLGNLGPYVNRYIDSSAPTNLTVYIFYILWLAEMGILGVLLLVSLYARAFTGLYKNGSPEAKIIMVILTGFLVQYIFFGSTINGMYIWLWLAIGLGYHKSNEKNAPKKRRTVSAI